MSLNWWQLPGPRRFIEQVGDDLRTGKNIVLCLPPHAPRPLELRQALFNIWDSAEEASISVNLQDYADQQNTPLKFLYSFFAIDPVGKRGQIPDIEHLFEGQLFIGKIIWIDGVTRENQAAWGDFLLEYEQKIRNHGSIFSRTVFVISLENVLADTLLEDDICLRIRRWRGVIDSFDALLYAASLYRTDNISFLHRQLAVSTIANLALWDLSLAEVLADERLEQLIAPNEMLRSLAKEKGWEANAPQEWHLGTIDEYEGTKCLHSVLFADSLCQTLKKRLWKAQVAVLLPFVEECRHDFLLTYGENLLEWMRLYVPKNSQSEPITEVHDLELKDLHYLFNQARVGRTTIQTAKCLLDIRNKLAHLQPLVAEDLPELPVN